MELSARKVIVFIIAVFAIFYSSSVVGKINENIGTGISSMQDKQCEAKGATEPWECNIKDCSSYDNSCSDEEREIWDNLIEKINSQRTGNNCNNEKFSYTEKMICKYLYDVKSDSISSNVDTTALLSESQMKEKTILDTILKGEYFIDMKNSDSSDIKITFSDNKVSVIDDDSGASDKTMYKRLSEALNGKDYATGYKYLKDFFNNPKSVDIDMITYENSDEDITIKYDYDRAGRMDTIYDYDKFDIRKLGSGQPTSQSMNYELISKNGCDTYFIFKEKSSGTQISVLNFDISCHDSSVYDKINEFNSINLKIPDKLPQYAWEVVSKLQNLRLDNGKDAYSYLIMHSNKIGADANLVLLVTTRESRGDPLALSPTGAAGLTQFIPSTARQYGLKVPKYTQTKMTCYYNNGNVFYSGILSECNKCKTSKSSNDLPYSKCLSGGTSARVINSAIDERFNPRLSIEAGTKYINDLKNRYKGDVGETVLILTAYNAGPSIADNCKGKKSESETLSCVLKNAGSNNKKDELNKYIAEINTNYKTLLAAQGSSTIKVS